MDHSDNTETFVRQLTEHQNRIYGYVYSLVGDANRAADVVQETNLVLWRKIDEFQLEKPFLPWAFAIARFQVLAHLRNHQRDRFLLDAELIESLSEDVEEQAANLDSLRDALRQCIRSLTGDGRELIEQRYFDALSIAGVAEATGRTIGAVKVALLRVRRQLAACVENRVASEK